MTRVDPRSQDTLRVSRGPRPEDRSERRMETDGSSIPSAADIAWPCVRSGDRQECAVPNGDKRDRLQHLNP